VQVSGLSGVVAIAAGQRHSLALLSNGTVSSWGDDNDGQLGNGSTTYSGVPVHVSGLSGVVGVAAGGYHSLALLSGGTVKAWGDNANGQLGNATTTNSSTPVSVSTLTAITQIAGGSLYSLALNTSGQAFAWGQNNDGQLGNATSTDQHTPVQMSALGDGGQALGSGSEGDHSLIIAQPHTSLSATVLNFGSEPVGTPSASQTETVTNNGSVALVLGQASITGSDGDEFTITGDGCSNTTIPPTSSCQIGVRFDPKATGTPTATLRIVSNSPTSPNLVTLDPPPYQPTSTPTPAPAAAPTVSIAPAKPISKPTPEAHTAAVTCKHVKTTAGTLTLTCKLTTTTPHGRRVTIKLTHGQHAIADASAHTNTSTLTLTLKLPHGLKPGSYTLITTTINPTTHTDQKLKLTAIPKPRPRSVTPPAADRPSDKLALANAPDDRRPIRSSSVTPGSS
jgi:hypothetical protein